MSDKAKILVVPNGWYCHELDQSGVFVIRSNEIFSKTIFSVEENGKREFSFFCLEENDYLRFQTIEKAIKEATKVHLATFITPYINHRQIPQLSHIDRIILEIFIGILLKDEQENKVISKQLSLVKDDSLFIVHNYKNRYVFFITERDTFYDVIKRYIESVLYDLTDKEKQKIIDSLLNA